MFTGVSPEQEVAAAVLLHHLGSREARQFTEAIRAVDDGVATVALGVTQQEVSVCSKEKRKIALKHNIGSKIKRQFQDFPAVSCSNCTWFLFALESKFA